MSRAMITTSGASSTGRLLATLIMSAAIVGTLSHEVASGTGTERGATYSSNFTMHSTHLRSHLLSGYDRHVPPTSDRSLLGVEYSSAGTDVEVQIRFFKVESVRASHGDMKLKIWMRTYHSDLRLSWNPEDYGGLEYVDFWVDPAPSGSGTEIWIPDVQPYNALHGIAHTLDPINAIVWSSGRVFISRPGSLEVMCKFSGLVAFPFDELGCKIEWGGWGWSGGQQGIVLLGEGYEFSDQEATSGSSYQEYKVKSVNVSRVNYDYECCPSEV